MKLNKNYNKNKMAKKNLIIERLQELAGIEVTSPTGYDGEDFTMDESKIEEVKAKMMNESTDVWAALMGMVGIFGAAGALVSLEMALEDSEFVEKHPEASALLKKAFGFMRTVGSAFGSGIGRDVQR